MSETNNDFEPDVKETTTASETDFSEETTPEKETFEAYAAAPASYQKEFAETFGELPDKWRKYLHAREDEIDKGFKELNDRIGAAKSFDEAYARRAEILKSYGVNSKEEWINNLIHVDELLSVRPQEAIKLLAETYHVGSLPENSVAAGDKTSSLKKALDQHLVQAYVDEFISARNDHGEATHPYFKEVVKDMCSLIQSGMAKDLDTAYETAVWLNRTTRDKLIAKRSQEALELKSKNAQKSKEASFAPKGKAELNTKDLSLREEIEMRYAALFGNEEDD